MIDTELLLRHTPEDAIVMMVNAENGTHFPTGTFEFGIPEVIDGRHTRIHLKVRDPRHKQDYVPYDGEFDYEYYRLDLATHFRDVLTGYSVTLPISTQVVLDELTRRTQQEFFLDDIVLEEIGRGNAAPYRLKAKAESLRWYGELEIWLAETQDLTAFFNSAILSNGPTRMGALNAVPQLRSLSLNRPYVNATPVRAMIDQLVEGNYAQDQPALVPLMQAVFPQQTWVLTNGKVNNNLFNARMVDVPRSATDIHPSNRDLTHVVELSLDLNSIANLDDQQVLIPYRIDDFADSDFVQPRLSRYGVKSLTDGTAYNRWLNGVATGSTLTSLAGTGGSFLINGPIPYVTDPTTPSMYNLHGSVVMYNGQRRSIDTEPADPSLNRVMVLALSAMNTAYRGNFSIHYRAPVVLPATLPNAELGVPYNFSLAATDGVGPYSYLIYDGAFAPGHDVHPTTGVVTGSASDTGFYTVGIEVIDSRGVAVRYKYTYQVTVAPLLITGNAPDGVVDQAYNFSYAITGGVAPYKARFAAGAVPQGLVWNEDTATFTGAPSALSEGPHSWTLGVTDARGNVQVFRTDSIIIAGA